MSEDKSGIFDLDGCSYGCGMIFMVFFVPIVAYIGFSVFGADKILGACSIFGLVMLLTQIARYDPDGLIAGFGLKAIMIPPVNQNNTYHYDNKTITTNAVQYPVAQWEWVLEYDPETEEYKRVERRVTKRVRITTTQAAIGNVKIKRWKSIASYPEYATIEQGKLVYNSRPATRLPRIKPELVVQKLEPYTKDEVIKICTKLIEKKKEQDFKKSTFPNWLGLSNRFPERSDLQERTPFTPPPPPRNISAPKPVVSFVPPPPPLVPIPTTEELENALCETRQKLRDTLNA